VSGSRLRGILDGIGSPSILIVGDLILDRYVYGDVKRLSQEAPIQILDVTGEEYMLGGAANVADKLASLGAKVALVAMTGDDSEAQVAVDLLAGRGIDVAGVMRDERRPTTLKTRFIAQNQQVLRVDRESRAGALRPLRTQALGLIKDLLPGRSSVVVSDYAKGLLTADVAGEIIAMASGAGVPVVVDPKGSDFARYRGATVLTPNKRELGDGAHMSIETEEDLGAAGRRVVEETRCKHLVVTCGGDGMVIFNSDRTSRAVPTKKREVCDVTGAGDAVAAVIGLSVAAGVGIDDAAQLANIAGGIIVGQIGVGSLSIGDMAQELDSIERSSAHKILDPRRVIEAVSAARRAGLKIVFTNGCFDLLHAGHVRLLEECKGLGDLLIVGLNTDESVRRLKGPGRPIVPESSRANLLAALVFTDYIVPFDEDTPVDLIKAIKPDVLVKGGDYAKDRIVGWDVVEGYGGRVATVPVVEGFSTSAIVEKIKGGTQKT